MRDPGSAGPREWWEWQTPGMADPGSGEPVPNEEWTQLVLACLGEAETGIVQQVIYHSAISLVIQQ